ncbi:hypothetical protein PISMIDRAFT_10127 [Pisolithus microcarpus 441]|uniref:Uncharacterized protein n=1 Tax=Pisolithus microcarpus 441 TaxID=765257 RepID=A0A0C9Z689_9AGAM|nr:hypothetical protein BKA83DRAFT_10127 [Pisolithus microcarpus]KIK24721.1 hypothetical protein PISMIDRAFT_10127 [Pisolithus microcarpus 441]
MAPHLMHPATTFIHGFPPAQNLAVMQTCMEEMLRQYFGNPPPAHSYQLPAPVAHPWVDYVAALQQNFERHQQRGTQGISQAYHQAQEQQHQEFLRLQQEDRRRLHNLQLLEAQQQAEERGRLHDLQILEIQQHEQMQREQQLYLQEMEHQVQLQRQLEQQQHLSQALDEYGRFSGEHYAEDEERHHQRTAEQNPGANDDPPPPPPPDADLAPGPHGAGPGLPPPPRPPGCPPLLPLDPLVQTFPLLLDLPIHCHHIAFHLVAGHMLNLSSPTILDP